MKIRYWLWPVFVFVCLAQWAVPAMLIHAGETTLAEGTAWRFRTAPVDPYDPFVGRYVRLSYELERLPHGGSSNQWVTGQKLYARLEKDAEGFARFAELTAEPPPQGDYIATRVRFQSPQDIWLHLPFNRYYMNETQAPLAETAYGTVQREGLQAWTLVRVRDGHAIIEELYLDGRPVMDYLRDAGTPKPSE